MLSIADQLRTLRKQKGWSLDVASKQTGISKAMLGQIERSESSPTLATIWKIASGFRVSLSNLITPTSHNTDIRIVRAEDRTVHLDEADFSAVLIMPFDPVMGCEVFEITVQPKGERVAEGHDRGVIEHVLVTQGQCELLLEGEWKTFSVGDGVRFPADQPHGYRNLGHEPLVIHNIIYYSNPISV